MDIDKILGYDTIVPSQRTRLGDGLPIQVSEVTQVARETPISRDISSGFTKNANKTDYIIHMLLTAGGNTSASMARCLKRGSSPHDVLRTQVREQAPSSTIKWHPRE